MRSPRFAAIVLLALAAASARAEPFDGRDTYRRVERLLQSLVGWPPADREIIAPPGNIDPRMALTPPQPRGTMRVITPRGETGR